MFHLIRYGNSERDSVPNNSLRNSNIIYNAMNIAETYCFICAKLHRVANESAYIGDMFAIRQRSEPDKSSSIKSNAAIDIVFKNI